MSKERRADAGLEMIGVREYAEGYEVRIGTIKAGEPACIGGEQRDGSLPEDRDVIIAYNEGGHNSVAIDARDLVAWLLEHRSDLFAQVRTTHVYTQRVTAPLDRCLHCGESEASPTHEVGP